MAQLVLKKDILDQLTKNGSLFGAIAEELKIAPVSLPRLIYKNDTKLTQAGVLKLINEHLGINESELLEVIPDSADNNNTTESIMQASH